jgi:Flagellar basal body-associated protein FliL
MFGLQSMNKRSSSFKTFGAVLVGLAFLSFNAPSAIAQSSEDEGGTPADGPYYLELEPLSVPIRRKSGSIKYYMFLVTSMEFDEKEKKEKSRRMMPRLRDAFLQDLSGRSVLHKDKTRGMDFEKVRLRLKKQAQKVLGKNAPTGVHVVKVFKGN